MTDPTIYEVKVYANGSKEWFLNGERHRTDGPAYEGADGSKVWWVNGKIHREDGPAIEYADGLKWWALDGVEYAFQDYDGNKHWMLNGINYRTEAEYNAALNKKNSTLDGKTVTVEGLNYKMILQP